MPTLHRAHRPPRGIVLAEVVVAAAVLTVGVLSAVGVLAVAARDGRRAHAGDAAVALLAARAERWRGAPCATGVGVERTGALVERWRVDRGGALATLADTVTADGDGAQCVGVVAVAWCAP
ncbi:MAG TPA: hypothetical protein VGD56_18565 [Gemmatirosa sp.]